MLFINEHVLLLKCTSELEKKTKKKKHLQNHNLTTGTGMFYLLKSNSLTLYTFAMNTILFYHLFLRHYYLFICAQKSYKNYQITKGFPNVPDGIKKT